MPNWYWKKQRQGLHQPITFHQTGLLRTAVALKGPDSDQRNRDRSNLVPGHFM
jgi:hypothetical protein